MDFELFYFTKSKMCLNKIKDVDIFLIEWRVFDASFHDEIRCFGATLSEETSTLQVQSFPRDIYLKNESFCDQFCSYYIT